MMMITIQLSEIINNVEQFENKNYYSKNNDNIATNNNYQTNYLTPKMFEEFLFWLVRLEAFHHNKDKRRFPPPMISDYFVMLFRLMYGCGLRVSEALNLEKHDIDLSHKIIKIRDVKTGKGKTQKTTILPSNIPRLRKFFYKSDFKYNEKLFPITRATVWHYAKNAGFLAGLNIAEEQENRQITGVWTHLFRKSCAKRMLYDGNASRPLVQRKLRHSFREAVDTYLQADINTLLVWEREMKW
jgi:integrase